MKQVSRAEINKYRRLLMHGNSPYAPSYSNFEHHCGLVEVCLLDLEYVFLNLGVNQTLACLIHAIDYDSNTIAVLTDNETEREVHTLLDKICVKHIKLNNKNKNTGERIQLWYVSVNSINNYVKEKTKAKTFPPKGKKQTSKPRHLAR